MNRIAAAAIALVLAILLAGCTHPAQIVCFAGQWGKNLCNPAEPPPTKNLVYVKGPVVPEPGKAMVVFLLPGGAYEASVFEIKDNQSLLVGILAPTLKLAYQCEPGKRLFMAIGENADFMTADLLPNEIYYVLVVQKSGFWSFQSRVELKPIVGKELDSLEFKKSLYASRWVKKNDASEHRTRGNMAGIESKRAEYYPNWVSRPESERPHLSQGDGK